MHDYNYNEIITYIVASLVCSVIVAVLVLCLFPELGTKSSVTEGPNGEKTIVISGEDYNTNSAVGLIRSRRNR